MPGIGKERGSEGGRDLGIVLNRKGVVQYYKSAKKQLVTDCLISHGTMAS